MSDDNDHDDWVEIMRHFEELYNKQKPLGEDFEKVLNDNLDDLYDS